MLELSASNLANFNVTASPCRVLSSIHDTTQSLNEYFQLYLLLPSSHQSKK